MSEALERSKIVYKNLEQVVRAHIDPANITSILPSYDPRRPENIAHDIAWEIYRTLQSNRVISSKFKPREVMVKLGLCATNGSLTAEARTLHQNLQEWYAWDDI